MDYCFLDVKLGDIASLTSSCIVGTATASSPRSTEITATPSFTQGMQLALLLLLSSTIGMQYVHKEQSGLRVVLS